MSANYIGKGLIIYTDGGNYKSNPGPCGSGIHAILFNNQTPTLKYTENGIEISTRGYCESKVLEKKTFPICNKADDFIEAVLKSEEKYPVNAIAFKDIAIAQTSIGTNNIAELEGLAYGLQMLLDERPDAGIIFSDSEYCIKGLTKFLDKWSKNNWVSSTGKPVSNQTIWKRILELRNRVMQEKIPFVVKWLNGHGDYKGNKKSESSYANKHADELASIAASMSFKYISGISKETIYKKEYTLQDSKEKEKKGSKIHPLLVNKRLYFPYGGRVDKSKFFLGNPGYQVEDTLIGALQSDAQIGIVKLAEEDTVISNIESFQKDCLVNYYGHDNLLYTMMLDNISSSKNYQKLEKEGNRIVGQSRGIPHLEMISGEPLTMVFDPPYLFADNLDLLENLEEVLERFLKGDKDIKAKDITGEIYDLVEKEVKESELHQGKTKLMLGKTLKKEHGTNFKSLDIVNTFGGDGKLEATDRRITLVLGIDLPKRNQLKSIESEFPSVQLLSWNRCDSVYEFAVLIILHKKNEDGSLTVSGYGIWRGSFSSQLLIDKRVK